MDTHPYTSSSSHNATKTDLSLLLECLKYQMECPDSQKQALLTIYSICQKSDVNVELFLDMGGVMFVYNLSKSSRYREIKETALFTLGALVETNVTCKKTLCRRETFSDLADVLTQEDTPLTQRRVAVYLLSVLITNSRSGQTYAQTTGCLSILLVLFGNNFPFSSEATLKPANVTQVFQLWTSLSSALCGCVNNPQNEESQLICVAAFPMVKAWLDQISLPRTEMVQPICSFIAMTVSNNRSAQQSFSAVGALETLTLTLVRFASDAARSPLSCQLSVLMTRTLSACITDNADLASGLSRYYVVPHLLSLLASPSLGPDDQLPVMLTLGHCTEASAEHQEQLLKCGGLSAVITLLTDSPSEELRKAATFILQTCNQATTSLQGPAPGGGGGPPVRTQAPMEIEEYWESAKDILSRINRLEQQTPAEEAKQGAARDHPDLPGFIPPAGGWRAESTPYLPQPQASAPAQAGGASVEETWRSSGKRPAKWDTQGREAGERIDAERRRAGVDHTRVDRDRVDRWYGEPTLVCCEGGSHDRRRSGGGGGGGWGGEQPVQKGEEKECNEWREEQKAVGPACERRCTREGRLSSVQHNEQYLIPKEHVRRQIFRPSNSPHRLNVHSGEPNQGRRPGQNPAREEARRDAYTHSRAMEESHPQQLRRTPARERDRVCCSKNGKGCSETLAERHRNKATEKYAHTQGELRQGTEKHAHTQDEFCQGTKKHAHTQDEFCQGEDKHSHTQGKLCQGADKHSHTQGEFCQGVHRHAHTQAQPCQRTEEHNQGLSGADSSSMEELPCSLCKGKGTLATSPPPEGAGETRSDSQVFKYPAPAKHSLPRHKKGTDDDDALSLCSELLEGEISNVLVTPVTAHTLTSHRCSGCVLRFPEVTSRTFPGLQRSCPNPCDMHMVLQEATARYQTRLTQPLLGRDRQACSPESVSSNWECHSEVSLTPVWRGQPRSVCPLGKRHNNSCCRKRQSVQDGLRLWSRDALNSHLSVNQRDQSLTPLRRGVPRSNFSCRDTEDFRLTPVKRALPSQVRTECEDGDLVEEQGEVLSHATHNELSSRRLLETNSIVGTEERRKRQDFSHREVCNLLEGVKKFGSSWNSILWSYSFKPGRTNVDLAKKYQRLQKAMDLGLA